MANIHRQWLADKAKAIQGFEKQIWEAEIEKVHPIINHYQKHRWAWIRPRDSNIKTLRQH